MSVPNFASLNFDLLAAPYRWLEYLSFGPFLHRTREHFLPQLASCRSALVLGDGDGRFTAALLAFSPEIHIHAVDISPAMLRTLARRCELHASQITTEVADLRNWTPNPQSHYDLIATHFFLDCLSNAEVANLVQRLTPVTAPNALWLVSDFATPPTIFGRLIAAPLVSCLYFAFRLFTGLAVRQLPDHTAGLRTCGWNLQSEASRLNGLLIAELWQLIKRGI